MSKLVKKATTSKGTLMAYACTCSSCSCASSKCTCGSVSSASHNSSIYNSGNVSISMAYTGMGM